ncbi:MAG: glycosyltransferase [Defluviitaleaceae bacterium]|nr:glycosyltransferase [Defluviitaleaceae bacterium]
MYKISVIVPIYNIEDYVEKCVESILAQTHAELEIILINDGSTDRSGEICNEFARRDKRVRVIHKENGGLSSARNAGLDAAVGEFIGFVDGDDFIAPNFFETLLLLMKEHDADVSMCSFNKVRNGVATPKLTPDPVPQIYPRLEAMRLLLLDKEIESYVWNKLYRAELFTGVRFPLGMIFEDVCVMYKIFGKIDRLVYAKIPNYNYVFRETSILNKANYKKNRDSIEIVSEIYYAAAAVPELDRERCYSLALWMVRSLYYSVLEGAPDFSHVESRLDLLREAFERQRDFILSEFNNEQKIQLYSMLWDLGGAKEIARVISQVRAAQGG